MPTQDNEIVRRKPRQQRSQYTVDVILEASAQILLEDPSQFSTNQIAKRAGVSIGSLYQYFVSKDDIITALMQKHMDQELALLQATFTANENRPVETIVQEAIALLIELHRKNLKLRQALQSHASLPGSICSVNDHLSKVHGLIVNALEKHRDQLKSNIDCVLTATIICKALDSILTHFMMSDPVYLQKEETKQELAHLIVGYLN